MAEQNQDQENKSNQINNQNQKNNQNNGSKNGQNNGKPAEQKEPDINQLRKVRREKLANLQAEGNDPFTIRKFDVTHHSTDIIGGC